ncbi:uncharacterized protein Nmag_1217 [Natrialba magadii ATCC 43099]|uniref:LWR-salt protein n=1 Tax=Natrialba magadii (strain ATCC 43099 / DSM 3394 / CCM 3739 / CIP 104546 / IAM 13178 / JCM 8861 / NBRC 102185 / NCIMB 2190 / MS3) TaxID=547559 RepID=D3SS73_NATMM|nr:LWR-salt protein [Natrialba magadii]ADD04799.1 uncharacterized protein Nmag_1217 [Natrialba magadii ATCC 43099]ELY24965.1 hypothetical protein C500_18603 [Natrialba magadii ATCC 43099]
MYGQYVFRVRVRLQPSQPGISLEPGTETTTVTVTREAPAPGTGGWRFFRDTLWRGEIADEAHARRLAEDWLDLPVEDVSFSELQADEAYMDALKEEIADDLTAFKADTVSEVLSKYLGSSIRVEEDLDEPSA